MRNNMPLILGTCIASLYLFEPKITAQCKRISDAESNTVAIYHHSKSNELQNSKSNRNYEHIPKSIFSLEGGKDPFFPDSVPKKPKDYANDLKITGLAGTLDKRLAVINNRVFTEGEEGEIMIESKKFYILCEKINKESVVVKFGEPQRKLELDFPPKH